MQSNEDHLTMRSSCGRPRVHSASQEDDFNALDYCFTTDDSPLVQDAFLASSSQTRYSNSSRQGRPPGGSTNSYLYSPYRQFPCRFCAKRFKRKDHMIEHERTHTGERPYICVFCGKGFAKKTNLNTHNRSHHQLKS